MTIVKSRVLRTILMGLGWVWVAIAFLGVFIPVLPTTGPILLAAFLFSKSSERFDDWLLTNRFFGTIVTDWREGNGFTARAKALAVFAITVSFGITTTWFVTGPIARTSMWVLAGMISIYILTRPTKLAETSHEAASLS